jgi:hypothetical protein
MAGYAFIAVDGGTALAESPSPAENLRLKIPERGQDTALKSLPRFRIASQGRVEWAGRQLIGVISVDEKNALFNGAASGCQGRMSLPTSIRTVGRCVSVSNV